MDQNRRSHMALKSVVAEVAVSPFLQVFYTSLLGDKIVACGTQIIAVSLVGT